MTMRLYENKPAAASQLIAYPSWKRDKVDVKLLDRHLILH